MDLVPGDIVKVKEGDNIPADIRIIECFEMKVNNSSLTGESEDLPWKSEKTSDNPFETKNIAFFGTKCTAGGCIGVVFKTGDSTVIGQIANLATQARSSSSPITWEINKFIKIISVIATTEGVVFFTIGVIRGFSIITCFIFSVGIITANVPENLIATVTISLSVTAKRMAKWRVLVKNLESIETLGSTSCICSDKTGTLTQNIMTVSHVWHSLKMTDASKNL